MPQPQFFRNGKNVQAYDTGGANAPLPGKIEARAYQTLPVRGAPRHPAAAYTV